MASETSAAESDTRSAPPPPLGSRQTFAVFPPRLPMNASHSPSGDQRGREAELGADVAGHERGTAPGAPIVDSQICVRYSLVSGSRIDSRMTYAAVRPSGEI